MHRDTHHGPRSGRFGTPDVRETERDFDRYEAGGMGRDGYRAGRTEDSAQRSPERTRANMANQSLEARSGRPRGAEGPPPSPRSWADLLPNKPQFRAPKGYQRSDERIREELCESLTRLPVLDPSDIEVHVEGGEVTLTGSISSREMKYLAEELADRVAGVREVHNQLRIQRGESLADLALGGGMSASHTGPKPPA